MPRGEDLRRLKESLPAEWANVPILSYSQLMTADRCAFLWYMKYGLKLKINKKRERMDVGSFVHTFLDDLYKVIARGEMTQEEWLKRRMDSVLMEIVDNLDFQDQVPSVMTAVRAVTRYCERDQVLAGHTPVGSEEHFFCLVTAQPSGRRFILQGYVDLITIDSKGRVWVWDHKAPERMWSKFRASIMVQLPIYIQLLRSEGLNVSGYVVNQINSTDWKKQETVAKKSNDELFLRTFHIPTPTETNAIWSEFVAAAEDALDLMEGRRVARRSMRDEDCFKCDFAGPCHANLAGEPIEQAVELYSRKHTSYRAIPAGSSATFLED